MAFGGLREHHHTRAVPRSGLPVVIGRWIRELNRLPYPDNPDWGWRDVEDVMLEADRLEDERCKWSICEQLHYAIVEKDWEFVKSTICNLELMLDYIENEDSNEEEDEISDDIDDEEDNANG